MNSQEKRLETMAMLLPTLPGDGAFVGRGFAGGWAFRCLRCGSYARSQENYFPCVDGWLPVLVSCDRYPWACKNKWRLTIGPRTECADLHVKE